MRQDKRYRLIIGGAVLAALLTGCGSSPNSLAGSEWKLFSLKTPSGTEYDEAAYDMIIGETIYRFETDSSMVTSVGDEEEQLRYSYSYEKGKLEINGEDLHCNGTVKNGELVLGLGEQGQAVFRQTEEQ